MTGDQGRFQSLYRGALILGIVSLLLNQPVYADETHQLRARLSTSNSSGSLSKIEYSGLRLDGGSELTVISPKEWRETASFLIETLEETHGNYLQVFGSIPKFSVTVRLMDEETFYLATGAPAWTNAMYFKGQIVIPLPKDGLVDRDNMIRSIRHEYTHAVIHALSGGNCPGWLDEGLAQWAEGEVNPLLTQALSEWLLKHPAIPFKLLQGGFTKLPAQMVPAAYAQSLLGAKLMLNRFGLKGIGLFLNSLRLGNKERDAFRQVFKASRGEIEQSVIYQLPTLVLREKKPLEQRAEDLQSSVRFRAKSNLTKN
jgi:hypothetical protein